MKLGAIDRLETPPATDMCAPIRGITYQCPRRGATGPVSVVGSAAAPSANRHRNLTRGIPATEGVTAPEAQIGRARRHGVEDRHRFGSQ